MPSRCWVLQGRRSSAFQHLTCNVGGKQVEVMGQIGATVQSMAPTLWEKLYHRELSSRQPNAHKIMVKIDLGHHTRETLAAECHEC